MEKTGFVLVHGFWHDHHTWDEVAPRLEAAGHPVTVLDLPGAGAYAKLPESYLQRPLDAARYATERSPNAAVTQQERSTAVIAALKAQNARTGTRSVLVGHSMGGATVSDVAEQVPEEIAAVVYVSAFMLPPGMLPIEMIKHDLMAEALVPGLFLADPGEVGALRIDPKSDDPDYRRRMHLAYAGDVNDAAFAAGLSHKHPDEPAQVVAHPSPVTRDRYGRLPRHYVHCAEDRAVPLAGQREMVRLMDDAMGNATTTHQLAASHSPFHSQPDTLAGILLKIA